MATAYKVLGQSTPAATTATTLYTVPAATSAVASSIVICNQNTTAQTYRVAIRPAGATLAGQHYLTYDASVQAKDTHTLTLGITLATTDVVTVYASATLLSFNLFGAELT
jgi:glucose-6-phosphate dehydrogenase assembly protein OpcA